MSEPVQPRRRVVGAIVGIALVAIVIGAAWYLNSPLFHDYVRARLVTRLESLTGGRVEMGRLDWSLRQLSLVAHEVTIHGLEGPQEAPYVHADRVVIQLKILSLARRKIGLRDLEVDRPVIHLMVATDGSTNQPRPKVQAQAGSGQGLQLVFDLQADHLEVRDGALMVNDRRVPLDLAASNVQAQLAYAASTRRYDGSFSAGGIRLAYGDYKPFDSSVAASFSLTQNLVELKAAKLTGGKSWVEVTGQMVDFSQPRLMLQYRSRLDLAQIADITRLAQVRGGVLDLNGSGSFAANDFSTAGSVRVQNLEYRDPAIRLPDLDGGAEFKSEHNTLTIPHLFAHALGGTVTGEAVIRNWTSALKPGARAGLVSPAADAVAHLRLQQLSVGRIAAAISTRALPADKLNPVGSASGAMEVTFRGSPAHAHARFDVNVAPVAATSQQLPVSATIRGAYAIDTLALDLSQLSATARSLKLEASGALARNNDLRVALTVGNLRDLDSLLAALSPSHQLPDGVGGQASFTGDLTGTAGAPQLAGQVTLGDFTLPIPLTARQKASAPARLARFDSFTAQVQYSPSQLGLINARLRRGPEAASFTLHLGLDQGEARATLPLALRADIRNFEIHDLQAILGFDYPIAGQTTATLEVSGTADDPRGSGRLRIAKATVDGEPYQDISADVVFANREAQLAKVVIAHDGARVTGSAAYNLATTAFRFNLEGSNFSLAQFTQLQWPRISVGGALSFEAHGSGTTSAPVVDADLHVRDVMLNRERLGNLDAKAVTSAGVMRITARSDFPAAEFGLEGTIGMHGDFPAELALKFTGLDVDAVLHEFLRGRITGHSSISGAVTLAGPLRRPRMLAVNGDISQFSADMENVKVHNDGPLRFKVADQVVTLEQFHLAGEENTQLSATGTVSLAGAKTLDLRAEGNVHLKLLQIPYPDLRAGGMVEFNINARGTMDRPVMFGRAKIDHGTVTNINFPNGLSEINGVIIFNQDRMQIQSLTASSGGGTLTLGGFVTFSNTPVFNLTLQGRDIRLRYPQGLSTVLDGDFRLSGTTGSSTLSGTATVTKFGVTPQFDLALAIARARQAPEAPNPRSPFNNMRLAIHVVSTPELQVQSSLARLTGDVDLNIRGTATRPVLLGRVNVTEGQVTLNGTNYQLERGDVTFRNPVRIEPVLDVEASTRVRDYDITLGFHGPLERLSTTYRSDPPLPTSDIIALLAFGRTREQAVMTTEANPSFTESASQAILGQALNSASSTSMQRLFGVGRIKISPEVAASQALDPNARVTIEQQVSKLFTVTYVTDLTHSGQQIIQVEYNYSRHVSFLATRDQYGVVSFDVRIKRRRR